jgi:hypothetical protein
MAKQSGQRSGVAMSEQERVAAVAVLTDHMEELAEAKRDGDDDLWDDIANDGVEVVVGGARWELWLAKDTWTASRPTEDSEVGSAAFGEGDLIGTGWGGDPACGGDRPATRDARVRPVPRQLIDVSKRATDALGQAATR